MRILIFFTKYKLLFNYHLLISATIISCIFAAIKQKNKCQKEKINIKRREILLKI